MTILKNGGPYWAKTVSDMVRESMRSKEMAEFTERWWTPLRAAEYERLFNPLSVYDWIDPEVGRK
jgi:hypothetical protein